MTSPPLRQQQLAWFFVQSGGRGGWEDGVTVAAYRRSAFSKRRIHNFYFFRQKHISLEPTRGVVVVVVVVVLAQNLFVEKWPFLRREARLSRSLSTSISCHFSRKKSNRLSASIHSRTRAPFPTFFFFKDIWCTDCSFFAQKAKDRTRASQKWSKAEISPKTGQN